MKDCHKVYIKGNPNRGAEVIKALTDLGGINSESYAGDYEKALYYINPKGKIEYIYDYEFSPECLLVKEFYREITLPKEKWTDGDLLVKYNGDKKEYIVYSNNEIIKAYICVSEKGYTTKVLYYVGDAKIASKDDIKCFQELLHKNGKEWDFKNKKLIDWRWKPENNEDYWYLNDVGEICHTSYNQFIIRDNKHIAIGNCFKSEVDAFAARLRIKEILLKK